MLSRASTSGAARSYVLRRSSRSSANPTNTAVTVSTDDWTAAQLLGGKSAADLQENVSIDNFTQKISGTLKYVTGYTQFSGLEEEQSGHYLVYKIASDESTTLYAKCRAEADYQALDEDGIVITRVTDKSAQKVYIKAVKDGQTTELIYDLSDLVLEPSA